ncbi:MAG: hypothetical protein ACLSW4_04880 [Clostridia bacterium]|jgi:hypothetical protein|nr:hypothetical protein [Clostridium sp.]
MENAAKALTIAGGVLIAVMLAVLVYYVFTQWGESQKMQQEDVDTVKIEEFNKSYLSYEKVLYGSELLGLVNKMSDYNISDDVRYNAYGTMDLKVEIKLLSGSTDNLFNRTGTYSLSTVKRTIDDVMRKTVEKYSGKVSDSQWEFLAKSSNNSEQSFDDLCQELNISSSVNRRELQEAAKEYYKYVQFKRMKFKHKETTFYDTGRVKMMSFIETR